MAAPRQNTNARKWTEDRVSAYLDQIETAVSRPDCMFLGAVLEELGLYRDIWAYWRRRFPQAEDMLYRMELIEGILESHLFESALRGGIRPSIAIICLKHVYGWRECHAVKETYEMMPAYMEAKPVPLSRAA